jgi:hypothetical protein
MPQRMIEQHEGSHCLHHWNRTRKNARIMAPAGLQLHIFAGSADGIL